jgi:hypothetical protein
MAKSKISTHQYIFDFGFQEDRIVLSLGQVAAQRESERLFGGLINGDWLLEPAGEVADVSSAQDIIQRLGRRLPYPQTLKVAQLHQVDSSFIGFSALYQHKGWVFVNPHLSEYERVLQTATLTASLALYKSYTSINSLAQRSEQLVFDVFLPKKEVETFFHHSIAKFSTTLAADIADFFKVPFAVVLKRALQLAIISDEQYRNFMTIRAHRPKKAKSLFVSKSGELEGDLEALFWNNEF